MFSHTKLTQRQALYFVEFFFFFLLGARLMYTCDVARACQMNSVRSSDAQ